MPRPERSLHARPAGALLPLGTALGPRPRIPPQLRPACVRAGAAAARALHGAGSQDPGRGWGSPFPPGLGPVLLPHPTFFVFLMCEKRGALRCCPLPPPYTNTFGSAPVIGKQNQILAAMWPARQPGRGRTERAVPDSPTATPARECWQGWGRGSSAHLLRIPRQRCSLRAAPAPLPDGLQTRPSQGARQRAYRMHKALGSALAATQRSGPEGPEPPRLASGG